MLFRYQRMSFGENGTYNTIGKNVRDYFPIVCDLLLLKHKQ